jgi:hypothetical protein
MAIEKYACTRNYGFGFPQCSYKYSTDDRTITMGNTAYIYIDGEQVGSPIYIGRNQIKLDFKDIDGAIKERIIPTYMVLERGVWKEYFTGTPLKWYVWKDPKKFNTYVSANSFKINSSNPNAIKELTKNVGVREFVVFHDDTETGWRYQEFTAQEFAKEISQYSKKEVESIVKQFYELQEMAKQWGPKFEKEAEQKVNELVRKKVSTLSTLEHNFGAYSRVESNMAKTEEINAKEEKGSQFQENESFLYKKLLIVLIIVVIILLIMYILK